MSYQLFHVMQSPAMSDIITFKHSSSTSKIFCLNHILQKVPKLFDISQGWILLQNLFQTFVFQSSWQNSVFSQHFHTSTRCRRGKSKLILSTSRPKLHTVHSCSSNGMFRYWPISIVRAPLFSLHMGLQLFLLKFRFHYEFSVLVIMHSDKGSQLGFTAGF